MGFPAIALGLAAVATTVSSGLQVAQGIQQKKAAEEAAKAEMEAAEMEAMVREHQLSVMQSTIRANVSAAGGEYSRGSAYSLLESNKRMAAIDIGLATKARSQAAFKMRAEGAAAQTAGIISGIGGVAKAGMQGAEAYSLT